MRNVLAILLMAICTLSVAAEETFQKDVIETSAGDLEITFIGHGSLMFTFERKILHVDPFSRLADYSTLPKADVIFITHHHRDHLDPVALAELRTKNTVVILTEKCA
ncbi:MAG: MBL fold metallo-hydrolase, partial [Candidatus Krumholzibacteria bacterium]|nr:MBL fold metallo-hydrolase [Candidatus Krumholzibacteria bacterium]